MSLLALYRPTGMLARQGVRTFAGSAVVAAKKTGRSRAPYPTAASRPTSTLADTEGILLLSHLCGSMLL